MGKREKVSARPELAQQSGGALKFITIRYEDEHLLCVEKPAAMHSVTLAADDPLTLADCIAEYCPECLIASDDPREAGLLQRLDFYTSGLIMAAKTKQSWQLFRRLVSGGEVRKSYMALVEGVLERKLREVSCYMTESRNKKRVSVVRNPSETREQCFPTETVIQGLKDFKHSSGESLCLARASGMQMRRHQVRAHLAFSGHPLVGDELYGAALSLQPLLNRDGFFLHAESVHFIHPFTSDTVEITSESSEQKKLYALSK